MLVTWTRACASCVTRPASKATVSGERSAFDQAFALPQVDTRASMRHTCRCAKSPQVSMRRPRLTASRPPRENTFWRRRPRGLKSPHLSWYALRPIFGFSGQTLVRKIRKMLSPQSHPTHDPTRRWRRPPKSRWAGRHRQTCRRRHMRDRPRFGYHIPVVERPACRSSVSGALTVSVDDGPLPCSDS